MRRSPIKKAKKASKSLKQLTTVEVILIFKFQILTSFSWPRLRRAGALSKRPHAPIPLTAELESPHFFSSVMKSEKSSCELCIAALKALLPAPKETWRVKRHAQFEVVAHCTEKLLFICRCGWEWHWPEICQLWFWRFWPHSHKAGIKWRGAQQLFDRNRVP